MDKHRKQIIGEGPIGIFDSGVGGLTVYRQIRRSFPSEDIVYFGDTARVPYGPKSRGTIIDYSLQNARFLSQLGAKVIVVACNTASAVALETLAENFPQPVVGVIEPGAYYADRTTKSRRIGVIGTDGTIRSGAYERAIRGMFEYNEVFSKACPLFVPLAEEGWDNHPVTVQVAREYLAPLLDQKIDTLVLGCTHYPILTSVIGKIAGPDVKLIDSAEAVSMWLKNLLPGQEEGKTGTDRFYVSDSEEKFRAIGRRIIGRSLESLVRVRLGETWFVDRRTGFADETGDA